MNPESTHKRSRAGTLPVLLAGLLVLGALLLWREGRSLRSARDEMDIAILQLNQMREDAERIRQLRATPQVVSARARPNAELLSTIEKTLQSAGIDRTHWQDSVPQPPARLTQTDYTRYSTQLYFDALTLAQLAAFTVQLQVTDPTLSVSTLHLSNRQPSSPDYATDLAVSYLVYSPNESRAPVP